MGQSTLSDDPIFMAGDSCRECMGLVEGDEDGMVTACGLNGDRVRGDFWPMVCESVLTYRTANTICSDGYINFRDMVFYNSFRPVA